MKWTLILIMKWAILILILVLICGCELLPSERDQLKANALHDSAKAIVMLGLKGQPQRKIQLGIAAGHVLALLESPDQSLQARHWDGLLSKIDKPEFQVVANDLLNLLAKYTKKPVGKAFRRLSKRDVMFLIALFRGIKEGSEFK